MTAPDELRDLVRDLRIELGILNDRIAAVVGLNPRDLDVLDVIDRDAPCSPSYLSDRTGIRRATLTNVLARLEADGWISRSPDPNDGRSAVLTATARFDELRTHYSDGTARVRELARTMSDTEIATIARFLRHTTTHARAAGDAIAYRPTAPLRSRT